MDLKRPERLVILDLDGLRRDVFEAALAAGQIPALERIMGGRDAPAACLLPAVSTAPSITFAGQASLVTGAHPGQHGIPGNELFDRLGRISGGQPRHFGFDVGDTLAVDDAIAVFADGLASKLLAPETPTLYERATARGLTSVVAHHMYARGATAWLPPRLVDIARFTKGRGRLGLEAGAYDAGMLARLCTWLAAAAAPPAIIMAYWMGLDHHSHQHGPASQPAYLREVVDPQVGHLWETLATRGLLDGTLFALVSDHGQIAVIPDDRHSIRLGFPFDVELGHVFKALRLDVHDYPGEDPACDAVVGLNGGLAHVYLQNRVGRWADPPRWEEDILPVAEAFHQMNLTGRYASELQGCLELILVRQTARDGWQGDYQAYLGDGVVQPLARVLAARPELQYVDAVNRLRLAASALTGDLILVANGRQGFYFGGPTTGVHGGLYPGDSEVVWALAYPGGSQAERAWLRETVMGVVADRCAAEGGRAPGLADLVPAVLALLGWE